MKKHLRVGEVATQLGVSPQTIRRYEKEGKIEAIKNIMKKSNIQLKLMVSV